MPGTHAMRSGRSAGVLISAPLDSDKIRHQDLIRCCHCSFLTTYQPGSMRQWGYCASCDGYFCGWKESCHVCVPEELLIENLELGLPYHLAVRHRPTRISLAGLLLPGG
jgi:hypothetical protein